MNAVKRKKGRSLVAAPADYVIVDIETTGLSPSNCEIIEIGALRCRDYKPAETFSKLIKPEQRISSYITELTGITNEMVEDARPSAEVVKEFYDFVGNDIILGYNVNFDINFLYDALLKTHGIVFGNDFVDVLRFARTGLLRLPCHSQTKVAAYYGIDVQGAHRALKDCLICNGCYVNLLKEPSVISFLDSKKQ